MKNHPTPGKRASAGPAKLVGATVSTVAVLRALCHAEGALRLVQITEPLGLNRSTGLNILRTLVHEGLVKFDDETKTYRITSQIAELALAAGFFEPAPMRDLETRMRHLADRYHVNVSFWAVRGERLVLQSVAESPADVKLTQRPGQRAPLLQGAIGRAVVAAMDMSDEEIARRFHETRWRTPQTLNELNAGVLAARRRGWADDGGSAPRGTRALAVAVRDAGGRVVGACAAVMFAAQYDPPTQSEIADALLEMVNVH